MFDEVDGELSASRSDKGVPEKLAVNLSILHAVAVLSV
jgi:hypothetical protein